MTKTIAIAWAEGPLVHYVCKAVKERTDLDCIVVETKFEDYEIRIEVGELRPDQITEIRSFAQGYLQGYMDGADVRPFAIAHELKEMLDEDY